MAIGDITLETPTTISTNTILYPSSDTIDTDKAFISWTEDTPGFAMKTGVVDASTDPPTLGSINTISTTGQYNLAARVQDTDKFIQFYESRDPSTYSYVEIGTASGTTITSYTRSEVDQNNPVQLQVVALSAT